MAYIDDIQSAFDSRPDIAAYRISIAERRSVGVGIRDNDAGSVYSPYSFGQGTGGGFLVQWQDGRLSRGNLDGNSLAIVDRLLDEARLAAYDDPDAAQFLGPQQVRDVELASPDVPALFDARAPYLLEVVSLLTQLGERYGARTLSGGVSAGAGESWLRSSNGLRLSTASTSFGYSATFDGIVGEGDSIRTVEQPEAIAATIEPAGEYLAALRKAVDDGGGGKRTIVFHPGVASSLFGYYVWGNLGGSAVYNGQSPFGIEEFRERKQVFRSDLHVAVDPWQPLGPSSFRYSSEGVPSAPITYIDSGCLTTPILDLKYARRLGLEPTTPPGGARSISFTLAETIAWPELLGQLKDAILVLSVLGLHTQDRSSGTYSLATSQALLVRDGELAGRVKVTLSGNLFDHLRDPALRTVQFEGQHSPGFVVEASIGSEH